MSERVHCFFHYFLDYFDQDLSLQTNSGVRQGYWWLHWTGKDWQDWMTRRMFWELGSSQIKQQSGQFLGLDLHGSVLMGLLGRSKKTATQERKTRSVTILQNWQRQLVTCLHICLHMSSHQSWRRQLPRLELIWNLATLPVLLLDPRVRSVAWLNVEPQPS